MAWVVGSAVLFLVGLATFAVPPANDLRALAAAAVGEVPSEAPGGHEQAAAPQPPPAEVQDSPSPAAELISTAPRKQARTKLKSALERARAVVKQVTAVNASQGVNRETPQSGSVQEALGLALRADAQLRLDDAIIYFEEAVRMADRQLARRAQLLPRLQVGLAFGSFWHRHGHYEEALQCADSSLALIGGEQPGRSMEQVIVAAALRELRGNAFRDQSQFSSASTAYDEARQLLIAAGTPAAQQQVALLEGEIGWALYRQGKLSEAHGSLLKAVSLLPPAAQGARLRFTARLGAVEHDEGQVESALGRYVEAAEGEMAAAVEAQVIPTETFETLQDLAAAESSLESPSAALDVITETVAAQKHQLQVGQQLSSHTQDRALAMSLATSLQLGAEFLRQTDHAGQLKALRWAQQALEIQRNCSGRIFDGSTVEVLNTIANIQIGLQQLSQATQSLQEAVRAAEAANQTRTVTIAAVYFNYGAVMHRRGEYQDAVAMYRKCLALEQELGANNPLDVALANNNIAVSLQAMGKLLEAAQYAKAAVALSEELPESSDRRLFRRTEVEIHEKMQGSVKIQ